MNTAEDVARRLVWWKPPHETLANVNELLARTMAYGALSDVQAMLAKHGKPAFVAALQHAPAGLFDVRSWRYWHLMLDLPVPQLPVRAFNERRVP